MRGAGKELIQNSYGIIANLLIYDLIIYAVITIAPEVTPLYDQFYQTCEKAISTGNSIQITGLATMVVVALAGMIYAISRLTWFSLLILRKILADGAQLATMEATLYQPVSYIAGIVTMANMGFKTFGFFIYNNWLLIASIGVFIRILPFELGKRAGPGLVAFAALNYLLIPLYPIFRDIFAFFLRETYPFAAYFPTNYIVLDGVFLGLYIGFILWLVGGISRMSFGIGALVPALGATAVISWTRQLTERGIAAIEQAAGALGEKAQEVDEARSGMLLRIEGVRGEMLALPAGNEGTKEALLRKLDELKTWVERASPIDILRNKDDMMRELDFELKKIERTIDTLFYEEGSLPKEPEPFGPETPPPRLLDTGEMVDKYERERVQPHINEVLGPFPPVVPATVGDIQIFTRKGDWQSIEGAKNVADYIGGVIPEGHRGYINRVFINSGYHHGNAYLGQAFQRPDGKTDIFLYHDGVTPNTTFHEVGHAVEHSFSGKEWDEWIPIHEILKHNYPPDFYKYTRLKETFADSYAKWTSNEPLPDNVKSFFDRNVVNREHREVK
jgi:hypothetical protein